MLKQERTGETAGTILVFGGTIEGRQVSGYLTQKHARHTVCVATEYGEEVLTPQPELTVHQGRMDQEQMREFIREGGFALVVDATHPYAVEVSKNIREACRLEQVPYLRYLRAEGSETPSPEQDGQEDSVKVYVNSAREAAGYLESREGGIFLTTGSKELSVFTDAITDKSRLFARVLPSAEVIASCRALGLEGKQLCAMQGPFSEEINAAMLRQTKAAFLVTKDTGISGGFPEKIEAARQCGVTAVIIRRPEESGAGWEEVQARLDLAVQQEKSLSVDTPAVQQEKPQPFDIPAVQQENPRSFDTPAGEASEASVPEKERDRQIWCIGIGMGTPETLTREAAAKICSSQVIFGARRILESARALLKETGQRDVPDMVEEYRAEKILAFLNEHRQYRRAAILMSGDVGFYSGARQVAEVFDKEEVTYFCGISSVVYFASKIPTSWQDALLLSAHGKDLALLNYVRKYPKILLLVSGSADVAALCLGLCEGGLSGVRVTVGSNLSYPNERILRGTASDFTGCSAPGPHIMMVENENAGMVITPGIPDEAFVRGKVPMTKEEVRALSVSKLHLMEDSVVCDVGAGTGSVSVECARLCTAGHVYAVERNPEGISLIRENSRKLGVANLTAVEGTAPEALREIPAVTHAFIGGSAGNMKEIIEVLRAKNPSVRIVINTIALESIAEVTHLIEELEIADADIVQIAAAKSRTLGRYHMMTAHNPIYIISFGGEKFS